MLLHFQYAGVMHALHEKLSTYLLFTLDTCDKAFQMVTQYTNHPTKHRVQNNITPENEQTRCCFF